MTRGPYQPDEPADERTPGRLVGYRTWQTLACINATHDTCTDGGHRCDCLCHAAAMLTGALQLHQEPA